MTSSNGNLFCVAGPLCEEFTGHRWIPLTKASDAEHWCFLHLCWIDGWVNNREVGDLRRRRAHYDVIVMPCLQTKRGWLSIKMLSYLCGTYYCRDTTVVRLSYLHNGISYAGTMASRFWISPQAYLFPLKQASVKTDCKCTKMHLEMLSANLRNFCELNEPCVRRHEHNQKI